MKKGFLFAALVAVVALVTAVAAYAADYRPPPTGSGATGPDVTASFIAGTSSNVCLGGQKRDGTDGDLVSGTYPFTFEGFAGSITLDVRNTPQGKVFDFYTDDISNHFVTSIAVKGGPFGANWYNYGAAKQAGADDGLHSPFNTNSGKWYGLSHICVFTDKK